MNFTVVYWCDIQTVTCMFSVQQITLKGSEINCDFLSHSKCYHSVCQCRQLTGHLAFRKSCCKNPKLFSFTKSFLSYDTHDLM